VQRFGQSFGCVVESVGWWFDLLNDNVWCWCRTMLVVVVVVVVVMDVVVVVAAAGFRSVRSVSAGWAMRTPRAKRSCTTLILRGRTKASCRRSRTIRCVVRLCVFKSALGSIRSSWNAQKRGRFGLALNFVFVPSLSWQAIVFQ
jgi:hypothetical protein